MGILFSASEVVQMGIQIEQNGKDYYITVAKSARENKTKEAFQYLAAEEEKHIRTFEDILSQIEKYEPPESYPGEYFAYLRALSEEYVFTKARKGEEIAGKVKSDREAIETGIGFEKDSILFYEEMKNLVGQGAHQTIDKLIEQEKEHLRKLSQLKSSLQV